jgi:MSHA biogenesis protein MshN
MALNSPAIPVTAKVVPMPLERGTAGDALTGLKVATTIALPERPVTRASALAAPVSAAPVSAAPVPAAPLPPAPTVTPTGASEKRPSSIDVQMRAASPQERAEMDYRRALGLLNQGRVDAAQEALRLALQSDPSHTGSRLLLSGTLVEQGKLDAARALLEESLAKDAAQPALAMRLARIQVERGDASAANEVMRRASDAATENAEFRGFHATLLQRLDRHKEAVAEYRAALRLSPRSGVWWAGLGISLENDGQPALAREAYERAKGAGGLSADLDRFVTQKLATVR